jgi:hypothetical protein
MRETEGDGDGPGEEDPCEEDEAVSEREEEAVSEGEASICVRITVEDFSFEILFPLSSSSQL